MRILMLLRKNLRIRKKSMKRRDICKPGKLLVDPLAYCILCVCD